MINSTLFCQRENSQDGQRQVDQSGRHQQVAREIYMFGHFSK